jgi:TIR domain/DDE superfamily endonuclease
MWVVLDNLAVHEQPEVRTAIEQIGAQLCFSPPFSPDFNQIDVVLDRWHAQIGASIARFIERIEECEYVIVVGTPQYRQKARKVAPAKGSVVAAEWDLVGIRLLAIENEKRTILPVLLAGEESESFPGLLRGRVYGDFRDEVAYFTTAFDLILSLHQLLPNHPAVADLHESLQEPDIRYVEQDGR